MEIDRAVRASGADRLMRAKYERAVYGIQRAFGLYPFEKVAFSFNGGKDSTALLHLLHAGYYIHKTNLGVTDQKDIAIQNFPMRTIYFEDPDEFPEVRSFTYDTSSVLDFKSGLETVVKKKPIKVIFLGTRNGDPNAVGQELFSPSSPGWPPFMWVNPILNWSYRDVWSFLLTCKVKYCSFYDQGYTSIGSIYDTVPNARLSDGSGGFKPAYMLSDGALERVGRGKNINCKTQKKSVPSSGRNKARPQQASRL